MATEAYYKALMPMRENGMVTDHSFSAVMLGRRQGRSYVTPRNINSILIIKFSPYKLKSKQQNYGQGTPSI
jgi:hypothetical protein